MNFLPISQQISEYYNITEILVKWLTTQAMITQFILELPCAFFASKYPKNIAVFPHLFPLLFTGQVISQLAWSLTTSRAGQLANIWCKSNEISFATVIGSTGFMLGSGLGYLLPLFIVKGTDPGLSTDANNNVNKESDYFANQNFSLRQRKGFLNQMSIHTSYTARLTIESLQNPFSRETTKSQILSLTYHL